MTYNEGMDSAQVRNILVKNFEAELYGATAEHLLEEVVSEDQAIEYARQAARGVLAPLAWSKAVGSRLNTTEVVTLLDVTRQALAKRVAAGTLLGLPGRGTTYYPTWQFDFERRVVRPEVGDVLDIFAETAADVDPLTIATWATTPQPEDLGGETPAGWLEGGLDPGPVFEAVRRAAKRLAS